MNDDDIDFLNSIAKHKFSNEYFTRLNDVAEARLTVYSSNLKRAKEEANKYPSLYRDYPEYGKTIKERKETYIQEELEGYLESDYGNEQLYKIPLDCDDIDEFIKTKKENIKHKNNTIIALSVISLFLIAGLM